MIVRLAKKYIDGVRMTTINYSDLIKDLEYAWEEELFMSSDMPRFYLDDIEKEYYIDMLENMGYDDYTVACILEDMGY